MVLNIQIIIILLGGLPLSLIFSYTLSFHLFPCSSSQSISSSMCVMMSIYVCVHACMLLLRPSTFRTFWPSQLSDLQNLLTFMWMLWANTKLCIMLPLPPDIINLIITTQISFFMHKPHSRLTTYTITSYVFMAVNPNKTCPYILTVHVEVNVETAYLNESIMDDWHSNTLFQLCYWKLP